jgi:hypothetical protein
MFIWRSKYCTDPLFHHKLPIDIHRLALLVWGYGIPKDSLGSRDFKGHAPPAIGTVFENPFNWRYSISINPAFIVVRNQSESYQNYHQ